MQLHNGNGYEKTFALHPIGGEEMTQIPDNEDLAIMKKLALYHGAKFVGSIINVGIA